jgi:NAD(P)-dependent dehydrogenase (short-subunit alcohol dehydrogenase family)
MFSKEILEYFYFPDGSWAELHRSDQSRTAITGMGYGSVTFGFACMCLFILKRLRVHKLKIVVTGAAGFLGKHISAHLKSAGHEVLELDLQSGHDLNDEFFVSDWFSHNSADALINCFAINDHVVSGGQVKSFFDIDLEDFEMVMTTNVVTLFSVCREFLRTRDSGTIINFSSIYSVVSPRSDIYQGGEKLIAYGVSKAAVNQISRHLAVHCAPSFSINTIVLGGVRNNQNSDFISSYNKNVPMGRMADPSDLYSAVDMLIAPDSRYITGTELRIDGGWTAI